MSSPSGGRTSSGQSSCAANAMMSSEGPGSVVPVAPGSSPKPICPGHWVNQTAAHAGDIQERSLARLVERGILRREDDRFMWVFHERRYPMIDNKAVQEVRLRIMRVLFSDEILQMRAISSSSPLLLLAVFAVAFCPAGSWRVPPNVSLMSARWT